MPEGPECYKCSQMLHRAFAGKRLVTVHIRGGRYAKHGKPANFSAVESPDNVYFVEVSAKGKLIYMNLSNDMTILSTLGLMGKWTRRPNAKHCDLAIEYADPKKDTDKTLMMYFKDQIHYGTFSVISTSDLPKKLSTLGIDVNDREEFTWEAFKVRARRNGKNTLPVFLMKQNVLCGIGNYLKAEIIYHARASVSSPLSDYNDEQLRRVYDACYRIPYECTFGRRQLHVYNRSRDRAGNKVYTVKTPDKRTTHWVPAVCPIDIRTDRPAVECGYTDCSGYGDETTGRAGRDDETDSSDSLYSVEE